MHHQSAIELAVGALHSGGAIDRVRSDGYGLHHVSGIGSHGAAARALRSTQIRTELGATMRWNSTSVAQSAGLGRCGADQRRSRLAFPLPAAAAPPSGLAASCAPSDPYRVLSAPYEVRNSQVYSSVTLMDSDSCQTRWANYVRDRVYYSVPWTVEVRIEQQTYNSYYGYWMAGTIVRRPNVTDSSVGYWSTGSVISTGSPYVRERACVKITGDPDSTSRCTSWALGSAA